MIYAVVFQNDQVVHETEYSYCWSIRYYFSYTLYHHIISEVYFACFYAEHVKVYFLFKSFLPLYTISSNILKMCTEN